MLRLDILWEHYIFLWVFWKNNVSSFCNIELSILEKLLPFKLLELKEDLILLLSYASHFESLSHRRELSSLALITHLHKLTLALIKYWVIDILLLKML